MNLNGENTVISEFDYSATPLAVKLGLKPRDCRLFMVFDGRWKMMHAEGGIRPMLFDLETDPDEFFDLAKTEEYNEEIDRLYGFLAQWGRRLAQRVTKSEDDIINMRARSSEKGILPFLIDGSEVPEELTTFYRGKIKQNFTEK